MMTTSAYSHDFFIEQQTGSITSAHIVVPRVLSLFSIKSVVDVGCGVGGWLKVFADHGISDCLGVDGEYVPRALLKIPPEKFVAADLLTLPDLGRCFDLACSLEVAEHLPEHAADKFVAYLVKAAPVVLFSAAIPRQGGTAHLNEQWPAYWAARFATHGYLPVDCIRPKIYGNAHIEWWYRQNILIFCPIEKCPKGYQPSNSSYELNRVDPEMVEHLFMPKSGMEALDTIRRALPILGRALVRKAGLHRSNP